MSKDPEEAYYEGKIDGKKSKELGVADHLLLNTGYHPPKGKVAKKMYKKGFEEGKKS